MRGPSPWPARTHCHSRARTPPAHASFTQPTEALLSPHRCAAPPRVPCRVPLGACQGAFLEASWRWKHGAYADPEAPQALVHRPVISLLGESPLPAPFPAFDCHSPTPPAERFLLRDTAQAIALFVDEPAGATGEIRLANLVAARIRTSPSCVGAREGRGGAVGGDLSRRQKGAR